MTAADINAAWSANPTTGPCNGTNGTFTGWSKFYGGGDLRRLG